MDHPKTKKGKPCKLCSPGSSCRHHSPEKQISSVKERVKQLNSAATSKIRSPKQKFYLNKSLLNRNLLNKSLQDLQIS